MKSHPIRPIRAVPQEARYWAVSVSGRRCGGRRWTESPAEWQPRPSLTFHQSIESISSGSQVTSFLPACTRRRCARDNEHEWGGGREGVKLTIQDALEKEKSQYPHALLRSVPPGYAFSAFSARCLLGSLSSALGRRLNICLRLQASAPIPTFNVPLLTLSVQPALLSPESSHKGAPVLVLRRAELRLSRLAASRCYSNGC